MERELLYETKGQVAWLTINREARRNSLSQELIFEMTSRLAELEGDRNVRVVCITAAGEKAFCSGADLVSSQAGGNAQAGAENFIRLLKKMGSFAKPLVARVNGPCLAGGLGLMLSCDIAIARDDAYFSTPEVNVGLFPLMIGALIYRHIGRKKAMDMALTGRRVSAVEAENLGLITRAVPWEKLDETVEGYVQGLAEKSPIGLAIGKRAYYHMADLPLEEALDYLCGQFGEIVKTDDAREGMIAFIEKRKPIFQGR